MSFHQFKQSQSFKIFTLITTVGVKSNLNFNNSTGFAKVIEWLKKSIEAIVTFAKQGSFSIGRY